MRVDFYFYFLCLRDIRELTNTVNFLCSICLYGLSFCYIEPKNMIFQHYLTQELNSQPDIFNQHFNWWGNLLLRQSSDITILIRDFQVLFISMFNLLSWFSELNCSFSNFVLLCCSLFIISVWWPPFSLHMQSTMPDLNISSLTFFEFHWHILLVGDWSLLRIFCHSCMRWE